MTRLSESTVLFADLRGSTGLFESMGNAQATWVVTHCTKALGQTVLDHRGLVVKTLGDGLLARFLHSPEAMDAALQMHRDIDLLAGTLKIQGALDAASDARLRVTLARGEVVEEEGDFFGDAVNVAARLLDHAKDGETLVTDQVLQDCPPSWSLRFRALGRLTLRGRHEPVLVHAMQDVFPEKVQATQFGDYLLSPSQATLEIEQEGRRWTFEASQAPISLGRSPDASVQLDGARVSRSHARIEWRDGNFHVADLSSNGTFVRFSDSDLLTLRRGTCPLHGRGVLSLGAPPEDPSACVVGFHILSAADEV